METTNGAGSEANPLFFSLKSMIRLYSMGKLFLMPKTALENGDSVSSTLVFQLEEVCGINVVAHKMKNVLGGI